MALTGYQQALQNELISAIPGATKIDILNRMFAVLREFCDFTNVWYEDITVNLVPNQMTYTLVPLEATVADLNRVLIYYDPQELPVMKWVDRVEFVFPSALKIFTRPSTAAVRVARVSKVPNAFTPVDLFPIMPDWFYQKFTKQIAAGVRRDFCMDQNKPWSNPQQGMFYGKLFHQYKSQARIDAIKGNVLGQINWTFPTQVLGSQGGL